MSGSESEKGPNQMPPIMMSVGSIAPEPPRSAVADAEQPEPRTRCGGGAAPTWAESRRRRAVCLAMATVVRMLGTAAVKADEERRAATVCAL